MKKFLLGCLTLFLILTGYLFYKKDDIKNYIDEKVASAKQVYGDIVSVQDDLSKELGIPVTVNVKVEHNNGITTKFVRVNVKGEPKKTVNEIKTIAKRTLASNETFKEFDVQITFDQEDEDDDF